MHHAPGDVPLPDGHMCPVPGCAATTDLDFVTEERWRRGDDGGADLGTDVEDDAASFAGTGKIVGVHGCYGATDTGVTDGFE
jgi:hypothetical protein